MILPAPGVQDPEFVSLGTKDCSQKLVRVSVYDPVAETYYEIPTVDSSGERDQEAVEVQIRRDGPGAWTRLSDIYFPAEWRGVDVFDALPLRRGENNSVPVKVEVREEDSSFWNVVHYGWLRKIGSGGDGRLMRMRVDDYVKILQNIEASVTFDGYDGSVAFSDVLSYVDDMVAAKDIPLSTGSSGVLRSKAIDDVEIIEKQKDFSIIGGGRNVDISQQKTFKPERDTLVDVLNWATGMLDNGVWSVMWNYEDERPIIFVGDIRLPTWDGTVDSSNVTVRKNLALTNLNPINTVKVTGHSAQSVIGTAVHITPSTEYPVIKIRHKDLYERAGRREFSIRRDIEAFTINSALTKAKELLREEVGGAGEASMLLNGVSTMLPRQNIRAKPVCGKYVQNETNEVTYGIERVTHHIPAVGSYTTKIDVGTRVREEDIDIVTATMADAKGTEGSADTILNDGEGLFKDVDLEDFFLPLSQ